MDITTLHRLQQALLKQAGEVPMALVSRWLKLHFAGDPEVMDAQFDLLFADGDGFAMVDEIRRLSREDQQLLSTWLEEHERFAEVLMTFPNPALMLRDSNCYSA